MLISSQQYLVNIFTGYTKIFKEIVAFNITRLLRLLFYVKLILFITALRKILIVLDAPNMRQNENYICPEQYSVYNNLSVQFSNILWNIYIYKCMLSWILQIVLRFMNINHFLNFYMCIFL